MDRKKAIRQLMYLKRYSSGLRLAAEKWNKPWKSLIATILSARTRDEKTIGVCNLLFRRYRSLNELANADLKDVEKIIRPVNFYKTKAKNIIECSRVLVKEYKGRVPTGFDKLIKLRGVGRKTANVFLSEIGKDAIGIDTHCAYISRKLGWTKGKNQKEIEDDLKRLFPKRYWRHVNPILVRFGRGYSKKKRDEILEYLKQAF
jgi:endonuclease-3